MATRDAAAASIRFLVLRGRPLAVVDLEAPDEERPRLIAGGLFQHLVERGLAVLDRFYGRTLPKGARLGFTVTPDELRLEDEQETGLLRIPRAGVDADWLDAAKRLRGTMVCVGHNLGVDPDESARAVCDRLDAAARDERVAGAIVGVAEPRQQLPIVDLLQP